MAAVPFIGSKISLVSKADLRYEGSLFTIDPANSTVSLSNVVCFGTEDRRPNVTPGSDAVYPFIVFKGGDIKTLYVIEDADPASQPESPPPNDPAIIGTALPAQSPNAAVIAAAQAKSDAEKSEKLLVHQMSHVSISSKQQGQQSSHPVGFPPRPPPPTGQYGYGYQPQHMWYNPAGAPPYGSMQNPPYPTMYTPSMPYPPMHFPPNFSHNNPNQGPSMGKVPMQSLPQSQAFVQNESSISEKKAASQQPSTLPAPSVPFNRNPTRNTAFGSGPTGFIESRGFRPNANVKVSQLPGRAPEANLATEFDFQSSNARFDKESFIRNLTSPKNLEDSTESEPLDIAQGTSSLVPQSQSMPKKYDKTTSFFDDISLDRDERGRKENRRGQNEETFGTMAAGYTASNYRRNFNNRNRRARSGNSTSRRNDVPESSIPRSPIRRTEQQQSSRQRTSPRSGDRKGKPRRGRRPNGNNPAPNVSRETRQRPAASKPSTGSSASATS